MGFQADWPRLVAFLKFLAPVTVPFSYCCFMFFFVSILVLCVPGALTRHIPLLHRFRLFLKSKVHYYWQLSLEGPLFKIIGRCGKIFCKKRLASHCQVPKAFKVKCLSTTEFEAAWTPLLPDNPFHEEHYIISYCKKSEKNGEADDWVERALTAEDYHLKQDQSGNSQERLKVLGKAQRKRLHIGDLPPQTVFRLRVCSAAPRQRSKWSPEVIITTLAKPSKNHGLTGPLVSGAPLDAKEFTWWQSKHEVGMKLAIPEDWKAKDLTVKVTGTDIKMQHEKGMLLQGPLGGKVRADEVDWVIENFNQEAEEAEGKEGLKQLTVTLRKEKLMQLWASFVDADDHHKVDTKLLQLFHEGNSMTELASLDLWE